MMRIFIHSWHGDFARTQVDSETGYLGGALRRPDAVLKLFRCGCGTRHLQRVRRQLWMRFVPGFRLYACTRCGARVFGPRAGRRVAYPAI